MKIHIFCSVCGVIDKKSRHKHQGGSHLYGANTISDTGTSYILAYIPVLLPSYDGLYDDKINQIYTELYSCFDDVHPLDNDIFSIFYDLVVSMKNITFISNEESEIVKSKVLAKLKNGS